MFTFSLPTRNALCLTFGHHDRYAAHDEVNESSGKIFGDGDGNPIGTRCVEPKRNPMDFIRARCVCGMDR